MSLHRQSQDFNYMTQNQSISSHLRNEYGMPVRHPSTIGSTPIHHFTSAPQSRPNITSNPAAYGPPQPLEPPANGTISGGGSPHMAAMSWASPNHGGLPSPSQMDFGSYPDPSLGGQQHMYFGGGGTRRPQSTEPEEWSLRTSRNPNSNLNHHTMHMMPDWGAMGIAEIKQERAYAM